MRDLIMSPYLDWLLLVLFMVAGWAALKFVDWVIPDIKFRVIDTARGERVCMRCGQHQVRMLYMNGESAWSVVGPVHDPDCRCHAEADTW